MKTSSQEEQKLQSLSICRIPADTRQPWLDFDLSWWWGCIIYLALCTLNNKRWLKYIFYLLFGFYGDAITVRSPPIHQPIRGCKKCDDEIFCKDKVNEVCVHFLGDSSVQYLIYLSFLIVTSVSQASLCFFEEILFMGCSLLPVKTFFLDACRLQDTLN